MLAFKNWIMADMDKQYLLLSKILHLSKISFNTKDEIMTFSPKRKLGIHFNIGEKKTNKTLKVVLAE